MRKTGLARGQGMKLAISSAPKARKVFVSHPRAGRRAPLGTQPAHLPCAKWSFWWVTFREQPRVISRECRRAARARKQSEAVERGGTASHDHPFRPGVPGVWTNVSKRVPAQAAPDNGEQGDAATLDGQGGIVESRPCSGGGGAPVAAAAEPVWRVGAVGHQHPRLAGRPRRNDLPDLDD